MEALVKTGWKTQINILWFGQAILMIMLAMSLPYWPLYIAEFENFTPLELRYWSGAIYIAPFVTSTFSSPLWGRLADKSGYKPMVLRACMGLFLTQTLILFVSHAWLIFVIRLLQGALAGFVAAAQAWALEIGPDGERGTIIGKLQSATALGNLLGPLVGGVIATYFGYHSIFTFSSLMCFSILILFAFLLQSSPRGNKSVVKQKTSKGLKEVFNLHSVIALFLITIIILQLARAMITPIFALFVTERLHGNDMTIGILYAATGLMIFISAPIWGKIFDAMKAQQQNIPNVIIALLLFSGVLQILHAYTSSAGVVFGLRLLWGLCLGALLPVLIRLLVDNSESSEKGLILGFGNSATKFGNLLGILFGALMEASFGYTASFWINAILYFLAAGFILMRFKALHTTQIDRKYSLED